jgi:glutathione synthase/RimK-type ligase-like ATP-grasp enzyme
MSETERPVAIWYEHPRWFRPLFRELERRGRPFARLHAMEHRFDPDDGPPGWSLFFNRMSPSAHLRGHGGAVAHTLAYLEHLEDAGVPVVNGLRAFRTEISKARQVRLLASLGLSHPATRVVADVDQARRAAAEIGYPVLVKANRGGSGAGIRRFADADELEEAAVGGEVDLGPDGTALVQDFVPARGNTITRVETLGGSFLYAIRVHLTGETFDLCPADICRTSDGRTLAGDRDGEAPEGGAGEPGGDGGLAVEAVDPPEEVIRAVEELVAAAGIDVGGVEYLVDDRDGTVRFYDVNALSNFVADAEEVVGFDPHVRLVDWLERSGAVEGGA